MSLFPRFVPKVTAPSPDAAPLAKAAKVAKAEPNFRNSRDFRNPSPPKTANTAPPAGPSAGTARQDIAPRISAYFERAAICAVDGISEVKAHRTAAAEVGATLDELSDLQVAEWRQRLAGMAVPNDPRLGSLRADLIEAAALPWLHSAAHAGWSDTDLFGVAAPDPFAPGADLVRGLAPYLVLAPWHWTSPSGRVHRCRVTRIEADRAKFQTPSGVQFGFQRFTAPIDHAVPIWTVPAFSPLPRH